MKQRHAMMWVAGAWALAGCGKPAAVSVDQAWVRLPAVPGRPGAAYFTLHGGAVDETLVAVTSKAALKAEMHESMAGGMRPIGAAALPAGGTLAFAPGGRHAMLFGMDPRLKPGAATTLVLSFADGRRLTTAAKVVAAGDAGPADPGTAR